MKDRIQTTMAVLILAAGFAVQADAQSRAGWEPYIGCWQAQTNEDMVLCFTESGDGVELRTVVDGAVESTETLVADGTTRNVDIDECTGAQTVEFSSGFRHVFMRSELACGDGDARTGSGIMSFVSATRWVDVRTFVIDGEEAVGMEAYVPVPLEWFIDTGLTNPRAHDFAFSRSGRLLSSRPLGNEDVLEALSKVDPAAVQMWVAAHPVSFDLDGKALVDLVDSGVPESVIDFMVARSYPERFSVDLGSEPTVAEAPPPASAQGAIPYTSLYRPRSFFFDPYYYPGLYGYGWYDYYWSYPYGAYRAWPVYSYGPGGGVIIVDGGGGDSNPPDRGGRIVNGRGYQRNSSATTGAPRNTSPAPASSAPSTTVGPSGTVSAPASSPAPAPSSQGTSSGRQARPRN